MGFALQGDEVPAAILEVANVDCLGGSGTATSVSSAIRATAKQQSHTHRSAKDQSQICDHDLSSSIVKLTK